MPEWGFLQPRVFHRYYNTPTIKPHWVGLWNYTSCSSCWAYSCVSLLRISLYGFLVHTTISLPSFLSCQHSNMLTTSLISKGAYPGGQHLSHRCRGGSRTTHKTLAMVGLSDPPDHSSLGPLAPPQNQVQGFLCAQNRFQESGPQDLAPPLLRLLFLQRN